MPHSRSTPWIVWAVGCFAYLVAVFNRTSLSALGPAAQGHFGIDATTLSGFAVLQLVVYAAMQIPVGILIDRVGPKRLIVGGTALMLVGQVLMATIVWTPGVFAARIIVGAGDAAVFTSVLRMVATWFPPRQVPVVTQLTGLLGQTGQLLSIFPLAMLVQFAGWTPGFLGLAGVGLLSAVLGVLLLRDSPEPIGAGVGGRRLRLPTALRRRPPVEPPVATGSLPVIDTVNMQGGVSGRRIRRELGEVLAIPGVRLAFWTHLSTPFSGTMLLMLWGFPFLVYGAGLSEGVAASLFLVSTVAGMVSGVLIGWLTSRAARHRVLLAVLIVLWIMVVWAAVLLWPGVPPLWLLVVLMVATAVGGPTSMIAFEIVRTHAPVKRLGTATGLVNVGGFTSALLVILAIGLLLDVQGTSGPSTYTLDAFRIAMSVQFVFWLLGLGMMWRNYGPAKRQLEARGGMA